MKTTNALPAKRRDDAKNAAFVPGERMRLVVSPFSFFLEVGGCLGEGSEWRLGLDPFYFFFLFPSQASKSALEQG
jgi:hypothetical protein